MTLREEIELASLCGGKGGREEGGSEGGREGKGGKEREGGT